MMLEINGIEDASLEGLKLNSCFIWFTSVYVEVALWLF